jgi:hypothetical protein
MATVEIVHADATLRIGVCRNLFVLAWTGPPEAPHLRVMAKALQALAAKHDNDMAVLDVIVSGRPLFTDEVRDGLVRVLRDPRTQGRASAHVIEIGGLAGVTTRAFLSTAFLLARSPSPNKVFGDVASGAAWLAPILSKGSQAWSAAEMVAAADAIAQRKPASATG